MAELLTLAILSGVLGFGLAIAADALAVDADPRIAGVRDRLPGLDCGACGYPGCEPFAEAIVEGEVERLTLCKPGNDKHYDAIIAYLKDHPNEDGTIIDVSK